VNHRPFGINHNLLAERTVVTPSRYPGTALGHVGKNKRSGRQQAEHPARLRQLVAIGSAHGSACSARSGAAWLGVAGIRTSYQRITLAREIGIAWDEAHALAGLGRCALAAGHVAEAAGALGQALEIFQRIGAAEAAAVAAAVGAELDALTGGLWPLFLRAVTIREGRKGWPAGGVGSTRWGLSGIRTDHEPTLRI